MNIDEQIEAMLNSRVKVRDIAEMDLRSIFRKHYDGFNKIRMHANMYSRSFQDEHLTYAKLIQELLTQNNIVQKMAMPFHWCISEMRCRRWVGKLNENKNRRKLKLL